MSEEKRFTNKKLIAVSIALVLMCGVSGVLGFVLVNALNNNTILSGDYDDLYIDYLELSIDFNTLNNQHFILTGEHIELENDYNILVIALSDMTIERDNLLAQIDILNVEISVHLITISNLNSQIGILDAEIVVLENAAVVNLETIVVLNDEIVVLNTEIDTHLATISGLESDLVIITDLRDGLQIDLDVLQLQYNVLLNNYQILFDAKVELQTTYDTLLIVYDYICTTIRQTVLPIQYSIFAEAVRRYYLPIYFDGHWNETEPEYWMAYAEFSRDIVLHDSNQYNAFSEVSNAFSDILKYGSDTMRLAKYILTQNLYDRFNLNRFGQYKYYMEIGYYDEFDAINAIHERCIRIDYQYSNFNFGQMYYEEDYTIQRNWFSFPVETALKNQGGIEDQAIFEAAHLEYDDFETIMYFIYDSVWFNDYYDIWSPDYHINTFVHINDINYFNYNYSGSLYCIGEIDPYYPKCTWCPLELGVQSLYGQPFGAPLNWIDGYIPSNGTIITVIVCDIDGNIEQEVINF